MGKSTISMVIFHSYVKLPEGKYHENHHGYDHGYDGMMVYLPWYFDGKYTMVFTMAFMGYHGDSGYDGYDV